MKRTLLGCGFLMLLALAAFPQRNASEKTAGKFSALIDLLDRHYMDTMDLPGLTESAIRAMLKELDPHSVYIPKKDVEKMNEPLVGSFDGIGISYQIYRDSILVISPTPDGPSERAGILAGDRIVKINGEDATGKKLDETFIHGRLRGKKGSAVELGVCRSGLDSLLTFIIHRDKIPINTVTAAYMLGKGTGYIRLTRFAGPSPREVHEAVARLKKEGMTDLVFDLRGNSGGYMNAAVDIAEEFLPKDRLVVYTEGIRSPRANFVSGGDGLFTRGRLVLLVDEGSASASEVFSGALQDWDRALLIGRRTYGKGLVQKPYFLPDGSQVRITTARYFTPTGRCIQRPYGEGYESYYKEFSRRLGHGELVHADSIRFPDSLRYETPGGRNVYGGGGIMPDIFMAVDSAHRSDYLDALIRKGVVNEWCLNYVDQNRKELKSAFGSPEEFLAGFRAGEPLLAELGQYAAARDIRPDSVPTPAAAQYLQYLVKALVGRNLYSVSVYQQVMNGIDPMVKKALEVIGSGLEFRRLSME